MGYRPLPRKHLNHQTFHELLMWLVEVVVVERSNLTASELVVELFIVKIERYITDRA